MKANEARNHVKKLYLESEKCPVCKGFHLEDMSFLAYADYLHTIIGRIPELNRAQLIEGLPMSIPRKSNLYLDTAEGVLRSSLKTLPLLRITKEEYDEELEAIKAMSTSEEEACSQCYCGRWH